ncbi:aldehyde dehydrogenase, partial [Aspergillus eucalypticola CBS 122712]
RVQNLLQNAVQHGATVSAGRVSVSGAIVQPVALSGITKEMDLYHQESFGPVVTLFEFDTIDQAVKLANDTEYGLVSSVFSTDILMALKVARRIKSGFCHINGPMIHDEPHLPLGGQKASGYGKFGGTACINEFTEDRVVTIVGEREHRFPI